MRKQFNRIELHFNFEWGLNGFFEHKFNWMVDLA